MSAPKPELTAELRAASLSATLRLKEFSAKCIAEGRPAKQSEMCEEVMHPLVREVVEIVAPSETVVRVLKEYREVYCFDDSEYGKAIDEQLARWGLK